MQPSSRRVGSDCSTTPPSSRDDLEDTLGNELGGHTWQFSAATVARMLSAKTRQSPLGPQGRDTLDAYDCDVDELTPALDLAYASFIEKDWPWPAPCGEKDQHPYFAKFLNGCVEVCHQALDTCEFKVKKADRWYSDLKFIPYGRPTKDSVPGVSSVYPSLTGGRGLQNDMSLCWSPLDESTPPILLPVEVNLGWRALVCKAAVHAHCLFSASPSRQYALVLGIECAKRELRFMIFHRGGLSASTSLSMERDYKEMLGLFLAILTWKSAEDAGFALWCNDVEFYLPRDENDKVGIIARTEKVLSSCPCVRGRATMVRHVSYLDNTLPPPTMEPSSAIVTALTPTTRLRSSMRLKDEQIAGEEPRSSRLFLSDAAPQALTEKEPDGGRPFIKLVGRQGRQVEFVAQHRNMHFKVPMQSLPPKTEKRADAVVKFSWPPDDTYGMEAEILEQCSGKFGLPMHHCSFQACYSSGQPMSNHLFLPQEESDLNDVHWKVFVPINTAAPSPEYRSLWVHVSAVVGQPLEYAKTPWELFQSVAHAMLGWLSMLQSGYLHRDISIGNILMVEEAVEMPNFAITDPDDLVDEFEKPPLAGTTKGPNVEQDLMGLLDDLDISDKCLGFTIDPDMAASLKMMFNKAHDRERTGTPEFMSRPLLESIEFFESYLQSPVDDLCSFYYVGQWAAVFNLLDSGQALSLEFQALRERVAGDADHRFGASHDIGKLSEWDIEAYPAFLVRCAPVFRKWHASIDQLVTDWDDVVYTFAEDVSKEKADDYYKPHFRAFAFRGVKEYLEILKQYRPHLAQYLVSESDP